MTFFSSINIAREFRHLATVQRKNIFDVLVTAFARRMRFCDEASKDSRPGNISTSGRNPQRCKLHAMQLVSCKHVKTPQDILTVS